VARPHSLGLALALLLAAPALAQPYQTQPRQSQPPSYETPIIAWTYVVQPGDTFAAIARRMGVSMAALAAETACRCPT
jgi:lipoprotein NlpD